MKQLFIFTFLVTLVISCQKEPKKKISVSVKHSEKIVEVKKAIPISKEETELLKQLMNEEFERYKANEGTYMNLNEYPYALTITDEAESRSTVYYSILASDDLNNDDITDYVVIKSSDGMAGSYFVFVIMKDKVNIKKTHEVLEYAPFSYNNLDQTEYKAKKIKAIAMKNPRAYNNNEETYESVNLTFEYRNDNLYEDSYLSKCKLAKLESKTIFNPIPNISRRERSIDIHNYTETISETYQTKDTLIHADLSGCDNPKFEFDITIPVKKNQINEVNFFKKKTVSVLTFLANKTQFSDEINPIIEYYNDNTLTEKEITIDDNLVFDVLARKQDYNQKTGQMLIRINIERRNNPNQIENWETTTRKK
jgi:hypothetical protein